MFFDTFLKNFAFQLKKFWSFKPFLSGAIACSCTVAVVAAGFRFEAVRTRDLIVGELAGSVRTMAASHSRAAPPDSLIELPNFKAGEFPELLNTAARGHGVVIDAVSYSLQDDARQPYQVYRALFTLSASYVLQRRVIAELVGASQTIVLDSMTCSREAANVELVCDVTISSYYAKARHG